jgi:16S rRNA (guanine527-N7)-methyltransferase
MDEALRTLLVEGAAALGLGLDPEAVGRFATYHGLLQLWGRKINLTTRLGDREIVVHHFLDSLAGAPLLRSAAASRLVDLGSGAGLPGIPLRFALPGLSVTLVESVRKKVAFCSQVAVATGIGGIEAVWGRGEELAARPGYRGSFDWATSRAVGKSADIVRLALPFLAPGGRVLLYKGAPDDAELRDLDALCATIGARWERHPAIVPHLDESRTLLVVETRAG